MSFAARQGSGRVRQGEHVALRNVIERVGQQFPELDADTVARTVYGKYDQFADAPVRDFIPVLTERAAREQLKTATSRPRR